jgi:hypothetical protein
VKVVHHRVHPPVRGERRRRRPTSSWSVRACGGGVAILPAEAAGSGAPRQGRLPRPRSAAVPLPGLAHPRHARCAQGSGPGGGAAAPRHEDRRPRRHGSTALSDSWPWRAIAIMRWRSRAGAGQIPVERAGPPVDVRERHRVTGLVGDRDRSRA